MQRPRVYAALLPPKMLARKLRQVEEMRGPTGSEVRVRMLSRKCGSAMTEEQTGNNGDNGSKSMAGCVVVAETRNSGRSRIAVEASSLQRN